MSSSSLSSLKMTGTVHVESKQVADNLGRSGIYTGSLDPGTQLPHGWGRMEYRDSSLSSEAEDSNGEKVTVSSYDGQWFAGDWSGYGETTSRGHSFEGAFLDNLKHGLGVLTYKDDGRIYDGFFRFGKIHGKGKMIYSDGSTYWGYWSGDELPHGRGKLTKRDGTVYDGEFESGQIQGHGRITYPDGRWYLGEFTDGIPNGLGLEVKSDGSLCHEGTFFNGTPVRSSSFPQQQLSSDSQLIYRTKLYGRSRALVGPLRRQRGLRNLFRTTSM